MQEDDYKFELKIGNNIISNPVEITEKLNMYFMNTVAEKWYSKILTKGARIIIYAKK